MAWICVAVVGVETLIEIKFGRGMFPKPHPTGVIIAWSVGITLFLCWSVWYYAIRKPSVTAQQPQAQQSQPQLIQQSKKKN
jgi:hypothetical protein